MINKQLLSAVLCVSVTEEDRESEKSTSGGGTTQIAIIVAIILVLALALAVIFYSMRYKSYYQQKVDPAGKITGTNEMLQETISEIQGQKTPGKKPRRSRRRVRDDQKDADKTEQEGDMTEVDKE